MTGDKATAERHRALMKIAFPLEAEAVKPAQ
jgi:hypothetical protein